MNAIDIFRESYFRRLKILHEIKRTSGYNWSCFLNLDGFDIVKFDEEVVKSPVGEAMSETIKKRYGEIILSKIHSLITQDGDVNG